MVPQPVLPADLRTQAWVQFDPTSGHLAAGLLGQRATLVRELGPDSNVTASAVGPLVQVDRWAEGTLELIDPASADTVARFQVARLDEPGHDAFEYPTEQREVDPAHGYLYSLSSGSKGVILRRFAFDGSAGTALATLAPPPGVEYWRSGVGFAINPDGLVVAISCSPTSSKVRPDHRCRLYEIPPEATGPVKPRILPAGPIPCHVVAAGRVHLVVTTDPACGERSTGRWPTDSYVSISLQDGTSRVTRRDPLHDMWSPVGFIEVGDWPWLIGEVYPSDLYPSAYGPYLQAGLVDLRGTGGARSVQLLVWEDWSTQVDAFVRMYGDWVLLQPLGPDYAACRLADPTQEVACPLGPAFLYQPATNLRIELPVGTY